MRSLVLSFLLVVHLSTPGLVQDGFPWQTLESGMMKVHWYQGDATFGAAALDAAQRGIESVERFVPVTAEQPVEIFIYSSMSDLQRELGADSSAWVAGHADPALGVVRAVVEPGPEQGITMEQRIPHELMHVLLYRHIGAGYGNLPAWLREGLATLAELYPNADYERVLSDAAANGQLIPLRELCVSFPDDAGQAFLAYAESHAFTRYLHQTYGSTRLLDLAATYADGVDCERGTERAFGVSFSRLEQQWRASISGQRGWEAVLQNTLPYLVLLCLVLIIPLIGAVASTRRKGSRHESRNPLRK